MHYYKFNIGDYRRDTSHLSLLEHGIYRQLIDTYYLDEKPIITQSVIRRLSIKTEEEKEALNNVLNDFFTLSECGNFYSHSKISKEITAYCKKIAINKANGSKGGRPKKTQSVISGLRNESETKGNQEPLTINQLIKEKEKEKKKKAVAFSRPSESDINNFALENNFNLDGMFDFYESNGWKVGKNAMKNWKATARNWNRRNNNGTQRNQEAPERLTGAAKQSADFHEDLKEFAATGHIKTVREDAGDIHTQVDKFVPDW